MYKITVLMFNIFLSFSVTDASSVWISRWNFGLWYIYTVFTALPETNSRESERKARHWCCANGEDIRTWAFKVSSQPYSLVFSWVLLKLRHCTNWLAVRMILQPGLTIWRKVFAREKFSSEFFFLASQRTSLPSCWECSLNKTPVVCEGGGGGVIL